MDSEFRRVLFLIFPPYDFPDLYWRLFTFNWLPNLYHKECFKKHCVDTAHRMEELCRQDNLLQETGKEDISYAYLSLPIVSESESVLYSLQFNRLLLSPTYRISTQKWSGYPDPLTEQCPWQLDVGTGLWNLVPSLVKRYFDQSWPESLDDNPSMATLWNETYVSNICAQFSHKGINFKEEYTLMDYKVYRTTYMPGFDVTWGPTRFYRGEFLLMKENILYPLRSGLPTFTRNQIFPSTFDSIVVTPKFDGSLVNILFIPLHHPYYKLFDTWFLGDRNEYGLFLVGSKQKLVMESHLRDKFDIVIGDFDTFIDSYSSYFQNCLITLHFEMMTNSSELNVYYPQMFCKFIGLTTFTNDSRRFSLAKSSEARAISQNTFQTIEACQAYLEELHNQFLKGDTLCEPEGCVLYFWDARESLLDISKRKFPEYLAVINPMKYPKEYRKILVNPLLAQLFQKIRSLKNLDIRGLFRQDIINEAVSSSGISETSISLGVYLGKKARSSRHSTKSHSTSSGDSRRRHAKHKSRHSRCSNREEVEAKDKMELSQGVELFKYGILKRFMDKYIKHGSKVGIKLDADTLRFTCDRRRGFIQENSTELQNCELSLVECVFFQSVQKPYPVIQNVHL
ncbi:uncharacterized protein TNCV_3576621 [Trichonephila clavipes]|nr:uncharacterized protein TNCV_3576621 [Trichonephila clavipes]